MNELERVNSLTHQSAYDLLLQVRKLANLNKKLSAIELVLTSYQSILSKSIKHDTKIEDLYDKISKHEVDLEASRHASDALTASLVSYDHALVNVLSNLDKRKDFKIKKTDIFNIDDLNTFEKSLFELSDNLNAEESQKKAKSLTNQITVFDTALNNSYQSQIKDDNERQQKLDALMNDITVLFNLAGQLHKIYVTLSHRMRELTAKTDEIDKLSREIIPYVALESNDDILRTFANSTRFSRKQKQITENSSDNQENSEIDNAKDKESDNKQVEHNEKSLNVDVEQKDTSIANEDEAAEDTATKTKKRHFWFFNK